MGYTKEAEIIWNKICDKFNADRNKTMITRTKAYEMINEALAQNLKQPDVIKSVCDYCGKDDMNITLCFECRTTRNDDKD